MDNSLADKAMRPKPVGGPGVRIPPPLVFIAMYLVGWLIQVRFPLPFLPAPMALALGGALLCGWLALVVTAIPTMTRRGGTLHTAAPSKALVTAGVYQISRNPMYLSLVLLYLGVACLTRMVWPLPFLLVALIYTQIVILREERYLERAFGASYTAYKANVRRWL